MRTDRNAGGRKASLERERTARRPAALRNLRQQRPPSGRRLLPRLGKEISVGANQTLLEALEAASVDMIFDCRRGECGLCALPILSFEGELDHRDVFFSAAEKAGNTKLCTCVSRVYGASITLDTADR
ncbi:2Fe-2S iron-sulfur cluster-binding protein [Bradyrhizobium sp.]|uniref:2Fe-2S iron-sulfur cluster-binding protein n=1 Tax=Bradyrhizobium sp. TaxID=376 RepID=UPI003C13B226